MSEMKHFAVYNGQNQNTNTEISDQALHQIYLTPYEAGFVNARAAATMCSYQIWQDTSTTLPATVPALSRTSPLSPYATPAQTPQTWPLNESHFSCEQPLTLTYALRDLWGSKAMVGLGLPGHAQHVGDLPGRGPGAADDQRLLQRQQLAQHRPRRRLRPAVGVRPDRRHLRGRRRATPSRARPPGAVHVAGIPGPGCPTTGLHAGARRSPNGSVPLSVFNQALATMLYQEQRFGMLGCDQTPVAVDLHEPRRHQRRPDRHRAAATGPGPERHPDGRSRHQGRRRGRRREDVRGRRGPAQERQLPRCLSPPATCTAASW